MTGPVEPWRRIEELALALTLTITAVALTGSRLLQAVWQQYLATWPVLTYRGVVAVTFLGLGLILALPTRARSGLTLGHRPPSWTALVAIVAAPVIGVAIAYPLLPERPYALASSELWLVSPIAEEIWFLGFIYGRLDAVFPGTVGAAISVRQSLLWTAFFFSLSHFLGGLFSILSPSYLAFQVAYTFLGCVVLGLTRQWTGSILYAAVVHMAVNYVAWSTQE